jgi:predicted permease
MRLRSLSPAWRRREEHDMREEMESLAAIAGPKELGNLTLAMENARAIWGWSWLGTVAADLRYALRGMKSRPGFTADAVLSLALAIGANSAMFSLADALLLRPLPVPDAGGLLDVTNATPDAPLEGMSFPDFQDLRAQSQSFSGLAAYRLATVAAAADASAPAQVRLAMLVSDGFFETIGVPPAMGRAFVDEETRSPGRPVAIISGDFARLGSTLRINGIPFTIVGVMPATFTGLDRFARPTVLVPLAMAQRLASDMADPLEDRGRHDLTVKGRLRPGVTRKSAQAELATLTVALERAYPKTNRNRRAAVRTEFDRRIRQTPQLLAVVRMLMGLVALILLIACSNLANLLLARARARNREMAIRLSIGAGRARLLRQLMTESLLLALFGGAAGVAFAYGGVLLLQTMSVPSEPPSPLGVQLDWRVAEFGLIAACVSCLIFGLAPAWRAARIDFVNALKSGGPTLAGERRTLGRDALAIAQIALAMVLLIAASLFLSGFRRILHLTPEFRIDHVISFDTAPKLVHYSRDATQAFYRRLVERVRILPGVQTVAMTETLPLSTSPTVVTVAPEGYRYPPGRQQTTVFGAAVDAAYFRTMRIAIDRGRAFTDADTPDSRRVAIVNEQFAKKFWPGQEPLGKRIHLDGPQGPAAEIVGVARTGHYLAVNETPASYVYLPYEQNPRARMTLIVQSAGDPAEMAAPLRDAVRSIDPDMPVFNLRTVATLYESRATGTWLQFSQMVGSMSFLGVALAMTGLYGLMAYTVNRRIRELGIRIAVGARRGDLIWLVQRRALVLSGIGVAIGAALTLVASPLLAAGFPGLGTSPPLLYAAVAAALVAVSALAAHAPARRAASLDPLRSLRIE